MRLLLIDDDDVDRLGISRNLRRSKDFDCEIEEAVSLAAATKALACGTYDCALLDLYLPDGTAFDLLQELGTDGRLPLPVVILSGEDDGEHSIRLLECGAQDYLVKGRCSPQRLVHAIRYAIARHAQGNASGEHELPTDDTPPPGVPTLWACARPETGCDIARFVQDTEFSVTLATTPEEADQGLARDPALALVDLDQPVLSDLARLRCPALFITSLDWGRAQSLVADVPACRVLVRPVGRERLLHEMRSLRSEYPSTESGALGVETHGFRFEKLIGRGGMGGVYRAIQLELERPVAIKVLPRELCADRESLMRFRQEAKVLARLDHPHIIPIFDLFLHQGRLHIVMAFAEGGSTTTQIAREGPLSETDAARLVYEAALGLHAASQRGIVHRDIKPDNLLLTADGVLRVADFGLAKVKGNEKALTQEGILLGTPSFMAPEQWDGERAPDTRSDLYALGCSYFFFLTGELPFQGQTAAAVMRQHILSAPPRVGSRRPGVSPETEAVIARLLSKRPEDRYASGAELAREVLPLTLQQH